MTKYSPPPPTEKLDIVAIDGPAGSGKSTVAKYVAQHLTWQYIDTGAMYRAITFHCLLHHIDFKRPEAIIQAAKNACIAISNNCIYLNHKDISNAIRTPEVTEKVSIISAIKEVRAILVAMQQYIGQKMPCVMEGRDITSVVFPDAKYKFYLDATLEARTQRRQTELLKKNISFDATTLKQTIEKRDTLDQSRVIGPLKRMPDALHIDTTRLSVVDVVATIVSHVQKESHTHAS